MIDNYAKQIEREKHSHLVGKEKYDKNNEKNKRIGNASNNDFGLYIKKHLLGEVVVKVEELTKKTIGSRARELPLILEKCLKATKDGTTTDFFNSEQAAFLAIQMTLDTALNPNKIDRKEKRDHGGDKKLLQKKTLTELEFHIGEIIQKQIALNYIQKIFPGWFRKKEQEAKQRNVGGAKATTSQWNYRMDKSMRDFADYLYEEGRDEDAEIVNNRKCWTRRECSVIGSLILKCVFEVMGDYLTVIDGIRRSNKGKPHKIKEVVLTDAGKKKEQAITTFVGEYMYDVLPMLVEPNPVTNDNSGGYITDILQEKEEKIAGSIHLSDKHLEFINRQARRRFEINPFIHQLLNKLYDEKLQLGKFKCHKIETIDIAATLGLAAMGKCPEQDIAIKNHPDYHKIKAEASKQYDLNEVYQSDNDLCKTLIRKADEIANDEYNYYPMKYDFRGRIYTRVPFISYQSADCGRYLIRFHEQTPIDNRTKYWLQIGIANAGGADKVSWDKRVDWFETHYDEIINVGKMFDGGDFDRAYDFLSRVEDPFCLAALANEFVKVFVDKTQEYTQVYVFIDCSCSGTSIFNAWRRNLHGAKLTNLVETSEPADIYMEVWREMKRLAPDDLFPSYRIKKLEKSPLLRKMMKEGYVPAQYASPSNEQHQRMKRFNKNKLKPKGLAFKDEEMKVFCKLWDEALNKVSSINTVIAWFQARIKEIVNEGKTEVKYTTANGSVMTLKYPKIKTRQVRTFHYGSANYRTVDEQKLLDEMNTKKMSSSITANITHSTDATALCAALWDWEKPFVSLHDAVGMPPGKLVDIGTRRLKEGLVEACRHSVWDAFRIANDLPLSPHSAPPIIGDLDLEDILTSNYLFA